MTRVLPYVWPRVEESIDRTAEIDRLKTWWAGDERMPVNLYGRRRVGKSWLFRRFSHGKPAVLLVAERMAEGAQLTRFAKQLTPPLGGVAPDLPDVAVLFRVLFRMARDQELLAVIDESPWLLETTSTEVERTLSAVQAVMEEERDRSQLKLGGMRVGRDPDGGATVRTEPAARQAGAPGAARAAVPARPPTPRGVGRPLLLASLVERAISERHLVSLWRESSRMARPE